MGLKIAISHLLCIWLLQPQLLPFYQLW